MGFAFPFGVAASCSFLVAHSIFPKSGRRVEVTKIRVWAKTHHWSALRVTVTVTTEDPALTRDFRHPGWRASLAIEIWWKYFSGQK
jgi:hypothetical protein